MSLRISVEGLREIQHALNRVPSQAVPALETIIAQTVFAGQRRMIAGSRRATGKQRAAITVRTRGTLGRVLIDPSAFYWRFQEYGTTRVPATPFVRPAREAEEVELDRRVKQLAARIERDWASGSLL